MRLFIAAVLLSIVTESYGFVPTAKISKSKALNSVSDRRSAFEFIGKALCGAAAVAGVAQTVPNPSDEYLLAGARNPAGDAWRASKKPHGQQFIPGKGLKKYESFSELTAGARNPAGDAWRASKKPHGQQFIPGKGLKNNESFNDLC